MIRFLKLTVGFYQKYLSGYLQLLFGGGCRYYPTCSHYLNDAVLRYGVIKGTFLGLKRIFSCQHKSNRNYFDPVI